MMRLILLLCAGRATASKSFSYKRDTVAASALRELADKLPPVDFERSCYERAAVSDAVAAVFGVPSGTKHRPSPPPTPKPTPLPTPQSHNPTVSPTTFWPPTPRPTPEPVIPP